MKKIVTLCISIMLILCTVALTACGGSVFDGNYTKVEKETIETFSQNVENAKDPAVVDEFGFDGGVNMTFSMKMTSVTSTMTIDFSMKAIRVENKLQMAGNMSMATGVVSGDMSCDFYYKDGYLYMNGTIAGATGKYKASASEQDALGQLSYDEDMVDLPELLDDMALTAEFYIEDGETTKKVKLVQPTVAIMDGMTAEGEMYFIFNADYKLLGAKIYSKSTMATATCETSIVAEPWSGEISFPDLSEYVETPL